MDGFSVVVGIFVFAFISNTYFWIALAIAAAFGGD